MSPSPQERNIAHRERWIVRYEEVRRQSERLCRPLAIEDYVVQTRPQVSPPKWHLAHVSWFFEHFLLLPLLDGYREFHPRFGALFNSYYRSAGQPWPRAERGLLSRPTVAEIYRYRTHVDNAVVQLLETADDTLFAAAAPRLELGLHHEQQHQELLLMDIKHNFAINPLRPAYRDAVPPRRDEGSSLKWIEFAGGLVHMGDGEEGFAYDNERPRHEVLLRPFRLATRLVTNGEFIGFMADGGYHRPELWLDDGWSAVQREGWTAPLYWERVEGEWWHMTLAGMAPVDAADPVCHVSYYEADAFARWSGHRLPSEQEWERAARGLRVAGNLYESGWLQPRAASGEGLLQMYGDVWEWTASPYVAYPGYRRHSGAMGEYNGKFMGNQWVLRGGACVTPGSHLRPTYRNFYYPHDRWQFGGVRLAEEA